MAGVRVYIDGFNVYHAIDNLQNDKLKWLNHYTLAKNLLRPGEVLDEVHFFTAVLYWNADKQARHVNYLNALRASGVTVHEANFKKARKHCFAYQRHCKFYEEKQTDVAIAVKLLSDAIEKKFARAILMTADSDQVPTAKLIALMPDVKLTLAFPPGRKDNARDLGNVIPDRKELSPGLLGNCLLPRSVYYANGKLAGTMPAHYAR